MVVRFVPQGPGHRFGKLTVADTASAAPLSIGLLGEGSGPVVSFTPAQITTVPGTFPSGAGLLSSALGLAVDWRRYALYRRHRQQRCSLCGFKRRNTGSFERVWHRRAGWNYDGHCRASLFHRPLHRLSSGARCCRRCDYI